MAFCCQRRISSAVGLERRPRSVGLFAVGLHDEVVRRPVEVDLDASVVGGFEGGVDVGSWQGRPFDELEEALFELAAGEDGLFRGCPREPRAAVMPVRALDRRLDGCVVVDAKPLGLGDRAIEVAPGCAVAARSSSVRATDVIGMPSRSVVSWASRERGRCTLTPAAPRRLRGTLTSVRTAASRESRPHQMPALRWLRTAPSPHASTAATMCPRHARRRWPTA